MKDFDEDQAPNNGSSSRSTTSTPQSTTISQSTPRYHSSNSSRSDGTPVKTRRLQEIYEVTQGNDDDGLISDFALFYVVDPIYVLNKQLNMKVGKRLWMKKLKQERKIKLGN